MISQRLCGAAAWLPVVLFAVAGAETPTLTITRTTQDAIDVAAAERMVEEGWVLQDSYNGDDWRDLEVFDGSPIRFLVSEAPSSTRLFRAAEKSLASPQEALTQARGRWKATGLTHYQYRSRTGVSGFLTDDLTLVRDGEVQEWISLLPPDSLPFAWGDQTIEDLFDRLQRAIDNDAHLISARYHPDLGYPEMAYVDESELIADEEWGISIVGLPAAPETAREANQKRWENRRVEAYEFDLEYQTAWFGWEGTVRVRDGVAVVARGEEPVRGHIVMTIDEMFDYLRATLEEERVSSAAYHPELGYPEFFSRDWHLTFVDGPGERFWITDFRRLGDE